MQTRKVHPAIPYQEGALSCMLEIMYMLLRQYRFPEEYRTKEKRLMIHSDGFQPWKHDHVCRCYKHHTGNDQTELESWLMEKETPNEKILEFLKDIFQADETTVWTGFRIMGSIHRGNHYPVWTFELFARNPYSDTKVYTGDEAPNVRGVE